MYVRENPVLQRELLTNLRMTRAFVLLFVYVALLGGVVYLAWPQQQRLDLAQPEAAKRLVNLFFFGQYMLASLMAPSFAAGAITGEKERMSYEMLLASAAAAGGDRAGQAVCRAVPPGHPDDLLAADRDALPAAGRRVAVRSVRRVLRDDLDGRAVRHDQPVGEQLSSGARARRWSCRT